ncbi:hypothetical protein SAMN03159340_00008 [Sphingomonas sp. NFR15]|nr:hypothetical protein SAMN03159340_00008 [Sphingomonas sp. NFR15]
MSYTAANPDSDAFARALPGVADDGATVASGRAARVLRREAGVGARILAMRGPAHISRQKVERHAG